jgi:ABC-type transporter Mla MlaB component
MGEVAIKISKKKVSTAVAISGPMTIANISELRNAMLKAFGLGKKVQLSVSGVTDLDVTGLQLLCSCHKTAIAKGLEFSVTEEGGGAVFSEVSYAAGMARQKGCDLDTSGTCIWKHQP